MAKKNYGHSFRMHDACKRGYVHVPQEPSVSRGPIAVVGINNRYSVMHYKHGRTYGNFINTNHDRVTAGRIMRDYQERVHPLARPENWPNSMKDQPPA